GGGGARGGSYGTARTSGGSYGASRSYGGGSYGASRYSAGSYGSSHTAARASSFNAVSRPNLGPSAGFSGAGSSGSRSYSGASAGRVDDFLGIHSTTGVGGTRTYTGPAGLKVATAGGAAKTTGPLGSAGAAGRATAVQTPSGRTYVGAKGAAGRTGPYGSVAGGRRGGIAVGPNGVIAGGSRSLVASNGISTISRRSTSFYAGGRSVYGARYVGYRGTWHDWNCFSPVWCNRYFGSWYPTAWYGAGVTYGVWYAPAYTAVAPYVGVVGQPVVYDYGANIYYDGDEIYVDGEPAASRGQYYAAVRDQAHEGADQPADDADQWLPLGVFGLAADGESAADRVLQLAVDKAGVLRGNYFDKEQNQNYPIVGMVDKTTQRAAWTVGDDTSIIFETGLYNLTKDEAPVLIHYGADHNESRTLVRLQKPADDAATGAPAPSAGAPVP
ncbi:MAG: hypothetical protein ACRDD1_06825, partial [Planctomycetia bacterium]